MSPSNLGAGLRRASTAWWRAAPAGEAGRGRGGLAECAPGQRRPGRRAFKSRLGSLAPGPAMISSFWRSDRPSRGCHVPGPAPCAALGDGSGRGRGHRGSQRQAERKGWRRERCSGLLHRDRQRRLGWGLGGADLLRTSISHPRKGEGRSAGQVLQLRGRMQAVAGQDGAAVPLS